MEDNARYLPQDEAAAICQRSYDTIRRYRKAGKLPNTTKGSNGAWLIAVVDLVAAGLLDALAANGAVTEVATRSRAERDLVTTRQELAVATATNQLLSEQIADLRAHVAFLQGQLKQGRAA
jgi:hypothetical protein